MIIGRKNVENFEHVVEWMFSSYQWGSHFWTRIGRYKLPFGPVQGYSAFNLFAEIPSKPEVLLRWRANRDGAIIRRKILIFGMGCIRDVFQYSVNLRLLQGIWKRRVTVGFSSEKQCFWCTCRNSTQAINCDQAFEEFWAYAWLWIIPKVQRMERDQ